MKRLPLKSRQVCNIGVWKIEKENEKQPEYTGTYSVYNGEKKFKVVLREKSEKEEKKSLKILNRNAVSFGEIGAYKDKKSLYSIKNGILNSAVRTASDLVEVRGLVDTKIFFDVFIHHYRKNLRKGGPMIWILTDVNRFEPF